MPETTQTPALRPEHTELVVLSILSDGPSYGYAISKLIAARSGDAFRIGPSQLYPLLTRLEKQGLVETDWEEIKSKSSSPESSGRKRKWYKLSDKGQRRLLARIEAHRRFTSIINSFIPHEESSGLSA